MQHTKGPLVYAAANGEQHTFNPCELHGNQPVLRFHKSVQWGLQVLVQCPECVGSYLPRHGGAQSGDAIKQACVDWNNDNPV